MKAPIHSRKHYVQRSLTTVVAGTVNVFQVAFAVNATLANLGSEVAEGALVKAVFVELWARGAEVSPGAVLISFVKTPDNQSMTFIDQTDLDGWTNKKNVFYHTQGLTNDSNADAIPFVRQWIKIPKSKQRMGLGDSLLLVTSAQALDTNICGFATYKEYT